VAGGQAPVHGSFPDGDAAMRLYDEQLERGRLAGQPFLLQLATT
jgi:hypothetical protein